MPKIAGIISVAAGMSLSFVAASGGWAQETRCLTEQVGVFAGDGVKIRLSRPATLGPAANFAVFRAPLAVNTDGSPNSYHPFDPLGRTLAINRFDNGIAIRSVSGNRLTAQQRLDVFTQWRDSGWQMPAGFRISWKNVLAATAAGTPCIFAGGENEGYFGSLTAARNGLRGAAAGECEVNDQLDQRFIPAIVLRGGNLNPLIGFGAKVADLVLAVNPETGVVVPAMIGDSGDGSRIGEASVALNRALLNRPNLPTNYKDAVTNFDTGTKAMTVAVFPGSRAFMPERPYTADSLNRRVTAWAIAHGYDGIQGLSAALTACSNGS